MKTRPGIYTNLDTDKKWLCEEFPTNPEICGNSGIPFPMQNVLYLVSKI